MHQMYHNFPTPVQLARIVNKELNYTNHIPTMYTVVNAMYAMYVYTHTCGYHVEQNANRATKGRRKKHKHAEGLLAILLLQGIHIHVWHEEVI